MATKKWMQDAVKKPGALRKTLGIAKDKTIPASLINKKLSVLKKKAAGDKKLTPSEQKLRQRLQFAKTAKKIVKKKK